ncbi:DUF4214 domain-containing protein [Clostridium polynesiense]|uniref:DUF4214 domain-containing protein n=1 Tax=Clostridium polynesiense TaxID=1325933 RepID=UPI0006935EDD|nr:DUF4214 domain-containing protein [Clostridium polynesiense]
MKRFRKLVILTLLFTMCFSYVNVLKTSASIESATGFVTRLYQTILSRQPDESGVAFWAQTLNIQQITAAEVADQFFSGAEFKSKNISDVDFVKIVYKSLLGRDPDEGGIKYWTNALSNGSSRDSILSTFVRSQEFGILCANYGIPSGSPIFDNVKKNSNIANLVRRTYIHTLGRGADENGFNYWFNGIYNGHITPAQMIEEFIQSEEFVKGNVSANEYINIVYKTLYDRNADSEGMSYWVNSIMHGYSRHFILVNCINSQEFKDTIARYNIKNAGELRLYNTDKPYDTAILGITKVNNINLRSLPSGSSSVITTIPKDSLIVVDKRQGSYYKVKFKDSNNAINEGYIARIISYDYSVDILSDNQNNVMLGVLSEKYESNGDPGRISSISGDAGGKSYGAWQLSSNMGSLNGFVLWLAGERNTYHNMLIEGQNKDLAEANTKYGSNFDAAWTKISQDHYDDFYQVQHKYTKRNFYDKLISNIAANPKMDGKISSFSVRNVLWSTSVQHGATGGTRVIENSLKAITNNTTSEFIDKVYAERGRKNASGQLVYFTNNSDAVQASVAKRFIKENVDAQRVLTLENTYIVN